MCIFVDRNALSKGCNFYSSSSPALANATPHFFCQKVAQKFAKSGEFNVSLHRISVMDDYRAVIEPLPSPL